MFDLTSLSLDSQRTLAFLLLLPVGGLITALFNGPVGLRTIGIFTPTILALDQVRSDWRVGVIIFGVTFVVGSVGRKLLIHSKLTTITRRGIIATVTVMLLALMVIVSEKMEIGVRARDIVLPVVILTLVIDRFYYISDKESNRVAVTVLGNTLIVTICCFIIFAYTPIKSIILQYPWLEIGVLLGFMYLGSQVKKRFYLFRPKPDSEEASS